LLHDHQQIEHSQLKFLCIASAIECAQDVSRIVEEFGEDVRVLFDGQIKRHYAASFEVAPVFIGADFWRPANA